jgi:tetratricopeptide (TPR) repeat protein
MNKHFQEVLSLAQSGRIRDAFERCEKLIRKNPRDTDYLLLAASLHASKNEFSQVTEYCKHAIQIDPRNIRALYNIGVAYLNLGDYQNARKYGNKLISLDKKNAKALSNLGLACWHLGEFEQAIENNLAAIKIEPTSATAHNNLGLAYKSSKNIDLAISAFKQAISINPNYTDALYNYGITLLEENNEAGNTILDTLLKINPNYPELHNYRGLKLLESGNSKDAITHFQTAITNKPNYFEAYCNLGNALMQDKNFIAAESMYRKAIEIKPDYANAYNNLGNALLDQDNYSQHHVEAEQCYLKAIDLAPNLDDAYKNLAVCYTSDNKPEKAMHYYKIYNERSPGNKVVIAGMGSLLERQGDFAQCKDLLEPYIDEQQPDIDILLTFSKIAKKTKQQQKAIDALLSIDDDKIDNTKIVEKYYALGKLAESEKSSPDVIFSYYKKANDREEDRHDIEKSGEIFNNIREYFTKEKISTLNRAKNNSKLPIFIVGMPRSGTSLAEQILDSHPEIYGAGELHDIHSLTQKLNQEISPTGSFPKNLDNMSTAYATNIAQMHLDTLKAMSPDSSRIVDKMPHNFQALGTLNLLFPKATVIHCTRSSIDTCLSIYFQHFNKHHAYANSLEMLGKYYNQYADLMEHWKSTLDINFIELNYENVIANPETEVRRLLDTCEVEWNPVCLKFNENKRTVMTPSYDQVRQPLYNSSVAKWKKYEAHLDELIKCLGERAN